MRVLILGGTQFVGRHIAEAHHAAGHSVTLFNRGLTGDALPPSIHRLRGDRDQGVDGIDALRIGTWDACIDVSGFTPRQVRPAVDLLRNRVERYIFISAVSVYGDPHARPVLESHARMQPAPEDVRDLDQEMYGRAKVACEDICTGTFGDRLTILRPQVVAGPFDPLDRFSYWVRRVTLPGRILAPGDGQDHVQFIDARDLACFTITAMTRALTGAFNMAGHRLRWSDFLAMIGATPSRLTWVPAAQLRTANITERELPLYRHEYGPRAALMHVSNTLALSAGLTLTDPATTANDTRRWLNTGSLIPALSPEREAHLLQLAQL